ENELPRGKQLRRLVVLFAAKFEGENAGTRAGDRHRLPDCVAEAAVVRIVAAQDVIHGLFHALCRHVEADVLRPAEGHELPASHPDVRAGAWNLVAPAAAIGAVSHALPRLDDGDGPLELSFQFLS